MNEFIWTRHNRSTKHLRRLRHAMTILRFGSKGPRVRHLGGVTIMERRIPNRKIRRLLLQQESAKLSRKDVELPPTRAWRRLMQKNDAADALKLASMSAVPPEKPPRKITGAVRRGIARETAKAHRKQRDALGLVRRADYSYSISSVP